MPSASKTQWAQLKVGLMTLVALIILSTLVWLMSGSEGFFKSTVNIYTYLDDSAAVADGAPVRLNGILIGKVVRVGLSGASEPNRVVKVTLEINREYLTAVPVDSTAAIAAENLLGTKYINIKKGRSQQTIQAGAEVKSLDTREFDELVQQAYPTLESLQNITKKVEGIVAQVEAGKGSIGKLLVDETIYNNILNVVNEADRLVKTLNSNEGTIGKLIHDDSIHNEIQSAASRINSLLDGLNRGEGTAGKLLKDPAVYDETRKTVEDARLAISQVRDLLAGLNRGEGTAGKLLKSDELHAQITETVGRLDTLLGKINNGEGTIGQLVVNPALYDSLNGTTQELTGLLKDFRTNPKKFLRIKLAIF
jgi:phospholipid/cholesterol/gamma-HCH transport system substrate-binding protein